MGGSLLRGVIVLMLLALAGAGPAAASSPFTAPPARSGVLDLRGWQPPGSIVTLDGEWQFVPGRFIDASQPWPTNGGLVAVPGAWNDLAGGNFGAGTFRLRMDCEVKGALALALPVQHSAASYFVNGRPLTRQGTPGLTQDTHHPRADLKLVTLPPGSCPMDLRVQASNFEMQRGGLFRSIQLGDAEEMTQRRERSLARSQLALGAMIFMGLFTLLFVPWRGRGWGGLQFAVFLFSYAISLGLTAERPLQPLVEGMGFEGQMRLVFCNWALGAALLPLMLRQVYPRQAGTIVPGLIAGFGFGGAALPLFLPARIFTMDVPLLAACGVAAGLYAAYVLVRAALARLAGAWMVLAGLAMLLAAGWHDALAARNLLEQSWLPYGMLLFEAALAMMLAQRFARALAAEELRSVEQHERTGMLVRATQAGLADWDAVRQVMTYSDRYKEMLGYRQGTPDSHVFDHWDLVHPDEVAEVREAFRRQLKLRDVKDGVRRFEPRDYRMRRTDGEWIWVHAEVIGICGPDGRVLRVISSFIDITRRHQIEDALATERERLRLLVSATKAGFGDWDAVNDVVTYSDRFKVMLGYPPDFDTREWPGIFDMMHPDDRVRARAEFREMIRRKPETGELEPGRPMTYRLRRRDGNYIWIHAEGVSLVDETGRTRRFITSYQDFTEFHEQEEQLMHTRDRIAAQAHQLEQQNETLKENVRLREEVERIGRHDLKTPLNSIVAVPRMLREERTLGAEADELLGIVERAGYRILSMVNLSLDLYKMEQGIYIFRPDAVDLAELLRKVVADVRIHAASKHVDVAVEADPVGYAWVEEMLCYSLLGNLLKNAVEASPDGARVSVRLHHGEGETLLLTLHNEGAVPPPMREHFFQKYATLGKASGTGLGTYSARLMARVQEGDITMRTSDAEGTTLTVSLRAAPPGRMPATARHASLRRQPVAQELLANLPPTRVLLVDDDEYNLLIVRRFLPQPPFTVDTAINGRVALSVAAREWPGVLLMDLDMPVMGGIETVRRLRAMEREEARPRCAMVALSSHDDDETRANALAAGFDRYLTKPVTREAIHELLAELNPDARLSPPAVPQPIRTLPPAPEGTIDIDADLEAVIPAFIASRRALLDRLHGASDAGDRAEVGRIAHQLAGAFSLYGFAWASEKSRWLEANAARVEAAEVRMFAGQLREHLDGLKIRFTQPGG